MHFTEMQFVNQDGGPQCWKRHVPVVLRLQDLWGMMLSAARNSERSQKSIKTKTFNVQKTKTDHCCGHSTSMWL